MFQKNFIIMAQRKMFITLAVSCTVTVLLIFIQHFFRLKARPSYISTNDIRTYAEEKIINNNIECHLYFDGKYADDCLENMQSFNRKYNFLQSGGRHGELQGLRLKVNETAANSLNFTWITRRFQESLKRVSYPEKEDLETKYILYWDNHSPRPDDDSAEYFKSSLKCPVHQCQIVRHKPYKILHYEPTDRFDNISAVLINAPTLLQKRELPPTRIMFPNAKFVVETGRAPDMIRSLEKLNGLVDLTVAYRRDSDIPLSSGYVDPEIDEQWKDADYARGKTGMAAVYIRNCEGKTIGYRNRLVQLLQQKGVAVDTYGSCGYPRCSEGRFGCYDMGHKFYLVFEQSLCNHLVTETFYDVLRHDIIPVVYGLGHELSGAPKEAYIDVLDFSSVQALADHLKYLDGNNTAYNEYFKWKKYYSVTGDAKQGKFHPHCQLCEILHNPTLDKSETNYLTKYKDVDAWFNHGQCVSVKDNTRMRKFLELDL